MIIHIELYGYETKDHKTKLFAAGGAAGGCAGAAGRAGGALEFSAAGKSKSGHDSFHFFAFAFRARNLLRRVENQFFKFVVALATMIFKDGHLRHSFPKGRSQRITRMITNYTNNAKTITYGIIIVTVIASPKGAAISSSVGIASSLRSSQ